MRKRLMTACGRKADDWLTLASAAPNLPEASGWVFVYPIPIRARFFNRLRRIGSTSCQVLAVLYFNRIRYTIVRA